MEDSKTIDLEKLRSALLDKTEQSSDGPFWKTAASRMTVGVFGALEAFGQPAAADVLAFLDLAGRFDEEGANELGADIAAWAAEADEAALAASSEWRGAYEDALKAAPETVTTIAADLRQAAAAELAKLG